MLIRYLDEAETRLDAILAHLCEVNPASAARFLRQLDRAYLRLSKFPYSGHRIPEFPQHVCLEFIVSPYRFFYFVDPSKKKIWIVDIWHGAQLATYPSLSSIIPT